MMLFYYTMISILSLLILVSSSTIIAIKCYNGIVLASDTLKTNSESSDSIFITTRRNKKTCLITPTTAIACADGIFITID